MLTFNYGSPYFWHKVVLTKFISGCHMVWDLICGTSWFYKSKTEKVTGGGKSAILPNWCCLLFITVLFTQPWPPRKMRCQAERENLKFDRATQLANGASRSKYCTHHSWLSVLLLSLIYLIPTVMVECNCCHHHILLQTIQVLTSLPTHDGTPKRGCTCLRFEP
jgi:hypothetical protein